TGDDGALRDAEEGAVLARDHAVRDVAELRDPEDLGVGLGVLRRVEDEVEDLLRRHAFDDLGAFATDHVRFLLASRRDASSGSGSTRRRSKRNAWARSVSRSAS